MGAFEDVKSPPIIIPLISKYSDRNIQAGSMTEDCLIITMLLRKLEGGGRKK